ncbi:hypothetical protein [Defluviimonas sp. SAOS-178_SWC]|uniref:hypothetical protein n=1 Tax=Defluviimonas sp. SAOS-178_SWC TaxID=3121287 RepID=UPI003221C258
MTGFSLFVLAAFQIWDIALTTKILRAGGRELNGIVASIMAAAGNAWGAIKYAGAMAAGIALAHFGYGWAIWLIIVVMAKVVDHNLTELHKIKVGDR